MQGKQEEGIEYGHDTKFRIQIQTIVYQKAPWENAMSINVKRLKAEDFFSLNSLTVITSDLSRVKLWWILEKNSVWLINYVIFFVMHGTWGKVSVHS